MLWNKTISLKLYIEQNYFSTISEKNKPKENYDSRIKICTTH